MRGWVVGGVAVLLVFSASWSHFAHGEERKKPCYLGQCEEKPRCFFGEDCDKKPDPDTRPPPPSRQAIEPGMVQIAGGCFQMGSPESEAGRESGERQHRVCVKDFALGRHEVTVGEFKRFVAVTNYRTDAETNAARGEVGCYALNAEGDTWEWRAGLSWRKPGYEQKDSHPVVCVSWNDANRYAEWLTKETGQTYRLPTEAEWEYAARAGTTMARYWGDDPDRACVYANVADWTKKRTLPRGGVHDCSDGQTYTAPVGSYEANEWGLRDMLGNVSEWTCSRYDMFSGGDEQKCSEKNTIDSFAARGGDWDSSPVKVRSAHRTRGYPTFRVSYKGFRLARSL